MTREEKEQTGKYVLKMARLLEDGCWQQKMLLNAVHIIDEAIEQEPILDKIRAEIIEKFGDYECDEERGFLYELLEVIDKYKGESEGEK